MAVEPRRELEAKLRRWLRTHHGIISFHEALRLGATPSMIKSKVRRGEWERVYRSVYRDTATPPSPYQDLRAAYVATDRRAVVSHGSAAWVWDLLRQPPATPELSVPATTRLARGEPGFTLHRSRDLDVAQAVNRNGLVVTNPLRTIVDLAGSVLPDDLTEAVDSAVARRLVTVAGLEAEIERLARPGRAGTGALRRHLFDRGFIGAPPPSVLEAASAGSSSASGWISRRSSTPRAKTAGTASTLPGPPSCSPSRSTGTSGTSAPSAKSATRPAVTISNRLGGPCSSTTGAR
jgi:hypothetical protein